MALIATVSTTHCIPHSPSRTHTSSFLCSPKLELKYSLGRCEELRPCCVIRVRAKESSDVYSSVASVDVPISRREAVLQAVSGAGRSLVAAGLASCAAALLENFSAAPATAGAGAGAGAAESKPKPKFYDLDGSGGVKALDIREGTGATPQIGDKVAIHYYARLAAKQGWRFDSSYDHKDQSGAPEPYVFVIGDGSVIAGLDTALRSMKEGGVRRVIIPPSQGYQNTEQGPIPPNFSDRQRLYTTIFNPTRLANGEGSTLGILVFDIELLGIRSTS